MIRRMQNKLLSLILTGLIAVSSIIAAAAETPEATVGIGLKKWDSEQKAYVSADTFSLSKSDDKKLYIPITVKTDKNVGGLLLKVSYDSSQLSFSKSGSFSLLSEDMNVSVYDNGSAVSVAMDTANAVSVMNGEIYYLMFNVSDSCTAGMSGTFKLKMNSLFDTSKSQNDISFSVTAESVGYSFAKTEVPSEIVIATAKLENITLNSQQDIMNAMLIFNSLSTDQKIQFKSEYPDNYEWLSTAQTRYNRLTESEAVAKLKKKAEEFVARNSALLALDAEKLTIADKEAVDKMIMDRKTLSDNEWQYVPTDKKTAYNAIVKKMQQLSDEEEERLDIESEINEFEEKYGEFASLTDSELKINCEDYMVILDEALLIYNTLSDGAKQGLASFYSNLTRIQQKCLEIISENEETLKVRNNVLDFQKQWLQVFMLNSSNVKVGDELAINMMLQAYNNLGEKEKALLTSKVETAKQLLTLISNMNNKADSTVITVIGGGNSNTVQNVISSPDDASESSGENNSSVISRFVYLAKDNIYVLIGVIVLAVLSLGTCGFAVFAAVKTGRKKSTSAELDEEGDESDNEEEN